MTIAQPSSKNTPAIHAVVVGIDAYTHLRGGLGRPTTHDFDMEQLASPVVSAQAFVDWLVQQRRGGLPLGSLELLLSGGVGNRSQAGVGTSSLVLPPTGASIMAALEAWLLRCNSNEGNQALFLFVGHGLDRGVVDPLLLAEDYGADPTRPLTNVIDSGSIVRAIQRTQVKATCLLFDCCREDVHKPKLTQMITADRNAMRKLVPLQDNDPRAPCLKIFSTKSGKKAYAPPGRSNSYFMQAVLKAFEGMGATDSKPWQVTTNTLGRGIKGVYEFAQPRWPGWAELPDPDPQLEGSYGKVECLHEYADFPPIPVEVTCAYPDAHAIADADLTAVHLEKPSTTHNRGPQPPPIPWEFDGYAGRYHVHANFPPNHPLNRFPAADEKGRACPPVGHLEVVV